MILEMIRNRMFAFWKYKIFNSVIVYGLILHKKADLIPFDSNH